MPKRGSRPTRSHIRQNMRLAASESRRLRSFTTLTGIWAIVNFLRRAAHVLAVVEDAATALVVVSEPPCQTYEG